MSHRYRSYVFVGLVVTALILLWTVRSATAQGPEAQMDVAAPASLSEESNVNHAFGYQGVLEENGNPVTGVRDMVFRLYVEEGCVTQAGYDFIKNGVPVKEGLFSVELNWDHFELEHLWTFVGRTLWLQVQVEDTVMGCQEILPVLYAHTLVPGARIVGDQALYVRGQTSGITAETNTGSAVRGVAQFGGTAGHFSASNDGTAVYAESNLGTGIRAESDSSYAVAASSYDERAAIYGRGNHADSYGGYFWNSVQDSSGLYAVSGAGIGADIVMGGLYGVLSSEAANSSSDIHLRSHDNVHVYLDYDGDEIGSLSVLNDASQSVLWVNESGDASVLGNLSKGSGSFRIDHPLDPENRYLSHSFVESPDMMNVYNGNVTLDDNGQAWVTLPEWFETLNRDYRYQLTPIGGPGPNLYVSQEVQDNRFEIAGGTPRLKVSWQVTGIRQDPYAEANRIVVEENKPPEERGTYLHPQAYGQPPTRALIDRQTAEEIEK